MTENVKTWVLLRGLTREHRHWEDFPEKLQQRFPGSNIIMPDLPGNGEHADLSSPKSIQGMMHFLRDDIARDISNNPVHIIGLSMGAMVAIEWMRSYPDECAAGILINTSLKGVSPFYQRLRPANYYRIFRAMFTGNIVRREATILQMTSNLYTDTEQLLQRWRSYTEESTVSASNAFRQLIAASRYRAPEQKPDAPILLLSSTNDHLVNSQSSESLARCWHLPIETHATAGHDIPLDDGDWVCEKISGWLNTA